VPLIFPEGVVQTAQQSSSSLCSEKKKIRSEAGY
jgi:hypothetical protein